MDLQAKIWGVIGFGGLESNYDYALYKVRVLTIKNSGNGDFDSSM